MCQALGTVVTKREMGPFFTELLLLWLSLWCYYCNLSPSSAWRPFLKAGPLRAECRLAGIPCGRHGVLLILRAQQMLFDKMIALPLTATYSPTDWAPAVHWPPGCHPQVQSRICPPAQQFPSPGVTCPVPHSDQEAFLFIFVMDRTVKADQVVRVHTGLSPQPT